MTGPAPAREAQPGDAQPDTLDWIQALRWLMGNTQTEATFVGRRAMTYGEISALASAEDYADAGMPVVARRRAKMVRQSNPFKGGDMATETNYTQVVDAARKAWGSDWDKLDAGSKVAAVANLMGHWTQQK